MARLKRSGEPGSETAGSGRLVRLARDLQRRKGRERRALFVAEGVRSVEEVVRARVRITGAIVSDQLEQSPRGRSLLTALESRSAEVARVSGSELAGLSDTENPQGVLAIGEIPEHTLETVRLGAGAAVLVLDGVQDPGNVGTTLRTAAAFGAAAVIALPGTVDLWNPKVVRGAMGAHFHLPSLHCETQELFAWLDSSDTELWGTATDGEPITAARPPARVALAVGNEGAGLTAAVRTRSVRTVALTLEGGIESLNVAVATGVLLFALRERMAGS